MMLKKCNSKTTTGKPHSQLWCPLSTTSFIAYEQHVPKKPLKFF